MNLIFVIGRNRSGTKWLSNIIANNKQVAAVQRKGAGGILECNLLLTYPNYLNINKNIEEKSAFEILFKQDNFHKCSGVNDEFVSHMNYRDIYDFFEKYAGKICENNNTPYFLQKASSNSLPILLHKYPDSKFVIIQRRNVVENVISNLRLGKNEINYVKIFRLLLGYWRFRKLENNFDSRFSNIKKIRYEKLKQDPVVVTKDVCEFFGLEYKETMLEMKYEANTSYRNQVEKSKYLTNKVQFYIKVCSYVMQVFPHVVYDFVNWLIPRQRNKFIEKTFEIYRKETQN